jgi:hypothetical protein
MWIAGCRSLVSNMTGPVHPHLPSENRPIKITRRCHEEWKARRFVRRAYLAPGCSGKLVIGPVAPGTGGSR